MSQAVILSSCLRSGLCFRGWICTCSLPQNHSALFWHRQAALRGLQCDLRGQTGSLSFGFALRAAPLFLKLCYVRAIRRLLSVCA